MFSSLRFKIIFLTIVPTTIIYFSILYFSVSQITRNETHKITQEMHQYTQYYASYYASFLRETMQIANSSASFLEQNLKMTKSQLYTLVAKNVELNPLIFGSAIAFDYEKLSNSNLFFAPYAYRTDTGIETVNIALVSDYTKSDWEWWLRAVEENKAVWTSPFISKEKGHILMATYAVPFFDKNELIGVTTVDVELSPLERSVSKLLSTDLDFIILTKKGDYLYTTDKKDILSRSIHDDVNKNNNLQLQTLAELMISGKTGMMKINSWGNTLEKHKEWVFYRPIPMTEWSFAVKIKEDKILEISRQKGLDMAVILLISLFVIVLVIWFSIGLITKPLMLLTQNVKEISSGKMNTIVELSRKDEIGILANNFSKMTIKLKKRGIAIRQARSRGFSHIVRQLSGKYFYFSYDLKGNITYVNKEVESILGYGVDNIKKNYRHYLTKNKINRSAIRKSWLLLNGRQQEPVEIEILSAFNKLHRLEIIEVPVTDENNNIIAIEGMAHDITERRNEEEKFRVLFDSSSEANLLFDSKQIIDCNATFLRLFGFASKDEILEMSPCELCPEKQQDGQRSIDIVNRAMERATNDKSVMVSLELQCINGALFPAELNITALTVSDSLFFIGIIHDMTTRIRAEQDIIQAKEAAEKANKAKSDFLSNMSHELRTPLNGVLGYAQILQNNPDNTLQQIQSLDSIENCGRHLLTLINDVLDLSKIESGILDIQETSFELKSFLYDVYDIVMPKAEAKGLNLRLELHKNIPLIIKTDTTKLRQILINLLGNAIKFTDSGSVYLAVKQLNDTIVDGPNGLSALQFSVVDSGIGIDKSKQDEIFQAFIQTKQGKAAEGTGLGLAISRHLARILGYSNIELDSCSNDKENNGSTFTFTIPIVDTEHLQITKQDLYPDRNIPLLESGQNLQALVVDDQEVNRDILVNFLEISGFEVKQASNGQQAIDIAMDNNFSLILMDLKMPIMSGFEVTTYLRNTTAYQSTSIFAVTANVLPDIKDKITRTRFNDTIYKPVRVSELFGKIRKHMAIRFIDSKQPQAHISENQLVGEHQGDKKSVELELLQTFVEQLKSASSYGDIERLNQLLKQYKQEYQISPQSEKQLERLISNFEFNKIQQFADDLLVSLSS